MYYSLQIIDGNHENSFSRYRFKYARVFRFLFVGAFFFGVDVLFPTVALFVNFLIVIAIGFFISRFIEISDKELIDAIKSRVIGKLTLQNDQLQIEQNGEIKTVQQGIALSFRINSYYNEVEGYGNSRHHYYGTDSYIEFKSADISEKVYLFLENWEALNSLKAISAWCLAEGYETMEFTKNERTYNGKKLSFKEIQELKLELLNNRYSPPANQN